MLQIVYNPEKYGQNYCKYNIIKGETLNKKATSRSGEKHSFGSPAYEQTDQKKNPDRH